MNILKNSTTNQFHPHEFREGDLEEEKDPGKPDQIGIVVEQVA